MKNSIKTLAIIIFTITSVTAQIKVNKLPKKINLPNDKVYFNPNQYLDLETIKRDIKSGKKCYKINSSSSAIIPPKYPKRVKAIDAYYTSSQYVRVEGVYLKSNGLLLRSDAGFSKYRGNNYEILIYPSSANKKEIDQRRIKITWNMPNEGTQTYTRQTFTLRHVSIQYKTYGILIIGDYNINGIIFGVAISLIPTDCLI